VANLWQAAALGLVDRMNALLAEGPPRDELTNAFWCACHGGQRATAELLLAAGADPRWVGHDGLTPLQAARRSGALELAAWLAAEGSRRG
jgi:ankyrin repeat protein